MPPMDALAAPSPVSAMFEDGADAPGGCALARLGRLAHQDGKQVGEVPDPSRSGNTARDRPRCRSSLGTAAAMRPGRFRCGADVRNHLAGEPVIGGRRRAAATDWDRDHCRRLLCSWSWSRLSSCQPLTRSTPGPNGCSVNPRLRHDVRSSISRTMSLKSAPGRSGSSRQRRAPGLRPSVPARFSGGLALRR